MCVAVKGRCDSLMWEVVRSVVFSALHVAYKKKNFIHSVVHDRGISEKLL